MVFVLKFPPNKTLYGEFLLFDNFFAEALCSSETTVWANVAHGNCVYCFWEVFFSDGNYLFPFSLTYVQDEKPLLTVPLLSCVIEELQGQNGFCLKQSKTSHVFCCDDLDVKQNWLTVLKLAVMRSLWSMEIENHHCGKLSYRHVHDQIKEYLKWEQEKCFY